MLRPPAAGIRAVESALLHGRVALAAALARDLGEPLRSCVVAEIAARWRWLSPTTPEEALAALEPRVPGLAALLRVIGKDKSIGAALEGFAEREAGRIDPATGAWLRGLALECHLLHNRVQEASAASLDEHGEVARVHGLRWSFFAAKTLLARDEPRRAVHAIDALVSGYPEATAALLHLRGSAKRQAGDTKGAVRDLDACLDADPYFLPPATALRFLLRKPGVDVQACSAAATRALQRNGTEPALMRLLADCRTAQGDPGAALPLLVEATRRQTLRSRPQLASLEWRTEPVRGPDFIVIGAPKCGTTSAYTCLCQHPKVLQSPVKEIGFFNDEARYARGLAWYQSHFPGVAGQRGFVTGESTPGYFYSPRARDRIARDYPQVRLILLLRDPVARAISAYYQHKKMAGRFKALDAFFEAEFEYFAAQPVLDVEQRHTVLGGGVYHVHIERWRARFGAGQLLILGAEQLFANPARAMDAMFAHIGVPPFTRSSFPAGNRGMYPEAPPALLGRLRDFYRPHNAALRELTGLDFGW